MARKTARLVSPLVKMDRKSHWKTIWSKCEETEVSWFQEKPSLSLELILRHIVDKNARILDVGGGSSRLVDYLLANGFNHLGVLDIAAPALEIAGARLGDRASSVEWNVGDVISYEPSHLWDVWHDRAVFHFLVDEEERKSYVRSVRKSLEPKGFVVIGTFGPDGPARCSGLDVQRHGSQSLCEAFGPDFKLMDSQLEMHRTPEGKNQQFQYCVFLFDKI